LESDKRKRNLFDMLATMNKQLKLYDMKLESLSTGLLGALEMCSNNGLSDLLELFLEGERDEDSQ